MPPYGWNPAMPGFMPPYGQFPPGMMYPGFPYPQDPLMFHHPPQNNPFLPPDQNTVNPPPEGTAPVSGEGEITQNADDTNNTQQNSDKPSEDLFPKNPVPPSVPMPFPPMYMGYENYMAPHMYQNNMNQSNSEDNFRKGNRNNNNNNNNNNRNNRNNNNNNKIQLPENERCTLRCTGIPTYTTEDEIKHFFEAFGHVVKLQVSPMEDHNKKPDNEVETGEDGEPKKKTYNECLIQYYSPQNAKKCLTSQIPILNNRYIRIYPSNFNIILPSDVEPPSYDIIEQDKALLSIKEIQPKPFDSNATKKKAGIHTVGVSNKWRKTNNDTKVPGAETSVEPSQVPPSTDQIPTAPSGNETSPQKPENTELKQEFEQLKTLKQQAEDILKQKERILQVMKHFLFIVTFYSYFNYFS
jgi:RNA recognition motif-containing protein